MKPIITLGETQLPDGRAIELAQRDQNYFLNIDGSPVMSNTEDHAQLEATELACSPVRSARQPKILVAPLGLGAMTGAMCKALNQKKAQFLACDFTSGLAPLLRKNKELLDKGQLDDPRLIITTNTLQECITSQEWSGIVIDLDTLEIFSPEEAKSFQTLNTLQRLYDSLGPGGMLVILASGLKMKFEKTVKRIGFDFSKERIPMSIRARKARLQTVWLLKKGNYVSRAKG